MKTIVHSYYFNLSNSSEKIAYDQLCENLKDRKKFCASGDYYFGQESFEVELDLSFLASDQWNTKCGKRVFDWAEKSVYWQQNSNLRVGHYLKLTDEMRKIRRDNSKCGYCGKLHKTGERVFCQSCLNSVYLNESDLRLLRLLPIDSVDSDENRPELTESEKSELLPLWRKFQYEIEKEKIEKFRSKLVKQFQDKTKTAKIEFSGFVKLLESLDAPGLVIKNTIFYSHSKKFGFGWANPLTQNQADYLRQKLKEIDFSFDFEIKLKGSKS